MHTIKNGSTNAHHQSAPKNLIYYKVANFSFPWILYGLKPPKTTLEYQTPNENDEVQDANYMQESLKWAWLVWPTALLTIW